MGGQGLESQSQHGISTAFTPFNETSENKESSLLLDGWGMFEILEEL